MVLADTIELMQSEDYKDRFKAEYYQLKIRYDKLKAMVSNWDKLDFTPTCPRHVYDKQLLHMQCYMLILENRADQEQIRL